MGKIVTYIVYFLILVAFYVLIKAALVGDINSDTTIGEAATEVKDGSIETLKTLKNEAKDAVDNIGNTQVQPVSQEVPNRQAL